MANTINFFWAGGTIPSRIKYNLKNWSSHLKESNSFFEIILWLDKGAMEALIKDEVDKDNISSYGEYNYKWSIGKFCIRLKSFEELCLLEEFNKLNKIYRELIKNKLYPIASDIARIYILNQGSGIYLDCDMSPNEKVIFPKTMTDFSLSFLSLNSAKFYLPYLNNIPENGMLFYFDSKGKLLKLLSEMNNINNNLMDKILYDSLQYYKFINSKEYYNINNLFYDKDEYGDKYIDAYKSKNTLEYRNITATKLKDYKGFVKPLNTAMQPEEVHIFRRGGLPVWNVGFNHFFSTISSYFTKHLKEQKIYEQLYKRNISKLIKSSQDTLLLYTWSDPGYGAISKLQYCANTIGTAYARKKGIALKEPQRTQKFFKKDAFSELIKIHANNAYDNYISWFSGRNNIGFRHRHGSSGRRRVQVLLNMMDDASNLDETCNTLRLFFSNNITRGAKNQKIYGSVRANPHSFISFFLNEIQKTVILYNKMKLSPYIENNEELNFLEGNKLTNTNRKLNLEKLSLITEDFVDS